MSREKEISAKTKRLRAARLAAVQSLYAMELANHPLGHVMDDFTHRGEVVELEGQALAADPRLYQVLMRGVETRKTDLDKILNNIMANRRLDRLEPVMRVLLRCGAYEIIGCNNIDAPVSISEYVTIATSFFDGSEPSFVNGVLDKIAHNVENFSFDSPTDQAGEDLNFLAGQMMKIENEFNRIDFFFKPLAEKLPGAFGLLDDAVQLEFPDHEKAVGEKSVSQKIVVTTDTIVEGIHFLGTEKPSSIARKLLGVNLSDLAAKAAIPHSYNLSLGLPDRVDDSWLNDFVSGLSLMQDAYDIVLSGGDSVRVPEHMVFSLTAIGLAPKQGMVRRDTANLGDHIYVTGSIGDAALGLLAAKGQITSDYLADRYFHPQPRLEYGGLLRDFATSSIDISDGLLSDTAKLMRASKLSARLVAAHIPLSDEVVRHVAMERRYFETAVTGGDDYEILFTVSAEQDDFLRTQARELGLIISRIGVVNDQGQDLVCVVDEHEKNIIFQRFGYSHR